MTGRIKVVCLLVGVLAVGAIFGGLLTMQMPASQAAEDQPVTAIGQKEKIVLLRELQPLRTENFIMEQVSRAVIGGEIWNDPLHCEAFLDGAYAIWDTGGNWDLFEGYFGIDDASGTESATIVFLGDGERLGSLTVHHGDKARFWACEMKRCRALQIQCPRFGEFIIANARLVSGRTKPSQPIDLIIDDGETRYIEQPGEYTFHVRKAH